jgi:hypothetical protein
MQGASTRQPHVGHRAAAAVVAGIPRDQQHREEIAVIATTQLPLGPSPRMSFLRRCARPRKQKRPVSSRKKSSPG